MEYSSPLDIPSIKMLIISLNTIGAWPHEIMGQKKWFTHLKNSKLVFIIYVPIFSSVVSYFKKNFNELSVSNSSITFINFLMLLLSLSRLTISWTKSYKSMTEDFFCKLHLLYHKNRNDYAMKTYKKVEKLSKYFCIIIHTELYVGLILFNLTPIYNSYTRGMFGSNKPSNTTYDFACYYDMPFNYLTEFKGYLAVTFLNLFTTFDAASLACIIDLYIFIVLFHLWGHIKILKYNLSHFPKPEMVTNLNSTTATPLTDEESFVNTLWYNEVESVEITNLLIDNIEYYRLIKEFMKKVCGSFSAAICIYLIFHQLTGCILLVGISQMTFEAFGMYGMLTFTLFQQLIQMSIIFELIKSQSETIKDAVYGVPWQNMNVKNRKIVLIFLCNVQNPMNLKALGLVPVGVQTMASILKTTISYFMLLRASTSIH